jgi:hypothetical protein
MVHFSFTAYLYFIALMPIGTVSALAAIAGFNFGGVVSGTYSRLFARFSFDSFSQCGRSNFATILILLAYYSLGSSWLLLEWFMLCFGLYGVVSGTLHDRRLFSSLGCLFTLQVSVCLLPIGGFVSLGLIF